MSTTSRPVSYDRHFDQVGFLGEGAGGGGGRGVDNDEHRFFATKSDDYHQVEGTTTSTLARQTVLVLGISLLANALLLGLFWYLVLFQSDGQVQEVAKKGNLIFSKL